MQLYQSHTKTDTISYYETNTVEEPNVKRTELDRKQFDKRMITLAEKIQQLKAYIKARLSITTTVSIFYYYYNMYHTYKYECLLSMVVFYWLNNVAL